MHGHRQWGDGFALSNSALSQLSGVVEDCQSVSNSATGILVNGNGGARGNKLARNVAILNGQNGISTTDSDAGLTIGNLSVSNGANNYLLDVTDINGPIVSTSGTLATTGADAHPHANYSR